MTFFLNAFPPHDKGGSPDIRKDISRIREEIKGDEFAHTLFTVGTKRVDPWIIAQEAMRDDPKLSPLIAVNPIHQHPLSVA